MIFIYLKYKNIFRFFEKSNSYNFNNDKKSIINNNKFYLLITNFNKYRVLELI